MLDIWPWLSWVRFEFFAFQMQLFLELVKVALGNKDSLSRNPSDREWEALYLLCQKQAIVSIAFTALDKLSKHGMKPPVSILYNWIGQNEQIKQRNMQVNAACVELSNSFDQECFDSCILKGQGNNLLYTSPYYRTPGDIDIWITPKDKALSENKRHKKLLRYIRYKYPTGNLHFNHIDAGQLNGISVEVHHRPRFMNNFIHNYRLQKWINEKRDEQFGHRVALPEIDQQIAIPTVEFNLVFQLAHIYGHVLQGGIGLRHLIDYYYLLIANSGEKKDYFLHIFKQLGLYKIAQAVMWVLYKQVGLKKDYLIVPADERIGRMLTQIVMEGGNFGQYNPQTQAVTNFVGRNLHRLKRDLRMMRYFPSECLWEPVFRSYHFLWRLRFN